MNLITSKKLEKLDGILSRESLIYQFFTKKQKIVLKILKRVGILSPVIFFIIYVLMFVWNPYYELFKCAEWGAFIIIILSLSIMVGMALFSSRLYKKYTIIVLNSDCYKWIVGEYIDDIDEAFFLIQVWRFKQFCQNESFLITKESLDYITNRINGYSNNGDCTNGSSLVGKWMGKWITLFVTASLSVALTRMKDFDDMKIIVGVGLMLGVLTMLVAHFIDSHQKDRTRKQKNKYQNLLKTIENTHSEFFTEGGNSSYNRL